MAWALGIATLAGGVSSALTFLPRITMAPGDPPNPANPFTAPFTITNSGFIPLEKVDVTVAPLEVLTQPRPFDENMRPSVDYPDIEGALYPQWKDHQLAIDGQFTITPEHVIVPAQNAQFSGADIAVVVHYSPWFLPWRRQRQFRFVTHRQPSGGFVWYSHPMQ
jgi:hypothetical protein